MIIVLSITIVILIVLLLVTLHQYNILWDSIYQLSKEVRGVQRMLMRNKEI